MPDGRRVSPALDPTQRLHLLNQAPARSQPLTGKVVTDTQERLAVEHDLAILRSSGEPELTGEQRAAINADYHISETFPRERALQTPTITQDNRLREEISGVSSGEEKTAPTIDQLASKIENQGEGIEPIDPELEPHFTDEEISSIQDDLAAQAEADDPEIRAEQLALDRAQEIGIADTEAPLMASDGLGGAGDKRLHDALVACAIELGAESEISPLTGERRLSGPAAVALLTTIKAQIADAQSAMCRALALKVAQQEIEDNRLDSDADKQTSSDHPFATSTNQYEAQLAGFEIAEHVEFVKRQMAQGRPIEEIKESLEDHLDFLDVDKMNQGYGKESTIFSEEMRQHAKVYAHSLVDAKVARKHLENDAEERHAEKTSRESIAVKLTDQQARLLLSSEYPGDRDAQNRALINVVSEGKPVDIMRASLQLDYSRDLGTFFAQLHQSEKSALEQKLLQLQKDDARSSQPKERDKSRQRERSRDHERV